MTAVGRTIMKYDISTGTFRSAGDTDHFMTLHIDLHFVHIHRSFSIFFVDIISVVDRCFFRFFPSSE